MLGKSNATPTIAVKDLSTARQFYETVLGLTVKSDEPEKQMVIYTSGNGEVQVYVSPTAGSNLSTYVTWEVPDIAAAAEELRGKGVKFEHYPDMPGVTMKGDVHSWETENAAWFKDPDDNVLCLHD